MVVLLFPVVLLITLNSVAGRTAIERFLSRDMLLSGLLVSPEEFNYRLIYNGSIFFTGATAGAMAPDCVQHYKFPVLEMLHFNSCFLRAGKLLAHDTSGLS